MPQPLCFETICVQNRKLINLHYHEKRLNNTRLEFFGYHDSWSLSELLQVPDSLTDEIHKCRISYGANVAEIRWEPYTFRTISSIQKVYDDTVEYGYKYEDRSHLNFLNEQKKGADEILIIKNGKVTDTLFCNVAFLKNEKWYTPATPLLPGTQRASLLEQGLILERDIQDDHIGDFSHIRLFNAMVDWENSTVLKIQAIR